jgi:hypothetical protein
MKTDVQSVKSQNLLCIISAFRISQTHLRRKINIKKIARTRQWLSPEFCLPLLARVYRDAKNK